MTAIEWRSGMLVAVLLGGACGPGHLGDLPLDTDGGEGTGGTSISVSESDSAADDTGGGTGEWIWLQQVTAKKVDVLFVIDDSSSMGGEQAEQVASLEAFANVLEDPEVSADVRFAFTTTDLGNPACAGTTPEDGAFVASSCVERLGDFVHAGQDVSASACLDHCLDGVIELAPTATALDPEAKPRPWLQRGDAGSNFDEGIDLARATACLLPQGIAGCDFASPFEAAHRALERARTPSDPAYGFIREDAHLFVVFLTNGDDCSSPWDKRAIFLRPEDCYDADDDGEADDCTQVYWSDPATSTPTRAVCWNAGVACSGAMPQPDGTVEYETCEPADKGLDGQAAAPEDAVLYPVQRYVDMFAELGAQKQAYNSGLTALPIGIAGVAIGYGDGTMPFATSPDPAHNDEFGIGPGCTDGASGAFATPAVRLRDVFGEPEAYIGIESICSSDHSPAMGRVADAIREQAVPGCVPRCAADVDPSTPSLEVDCQVREKLPPESDPTVVTLPPCLDDGGWVLPAPEVNACWYPRVIDGPPSAELHQVCVEAGWNLGYGIVRREGVPAPGGTITEISCVWSDVPVSECQGPP